MAIKEILLLLTFPLNFYIIWLTFNIINQLEKDRRISGRRKNMLFYTTLIIPGLGYFLVRKIEITEI
ncbi:hypothetical protein GZH53_15105 [Flavihumibacter sp. R14]|nr:hypothetical protein [Flavihumibacter soli]